FKIAQELYEQEKLTRQVYTIVNDFTDKIYYFNKKEFLSNPLVIQFEKPEIEHNEFEKKENDDKENESF
ncbi:17643_t:CDS:1, partial [Gigaspora rosea]